MSVWIKTGLFVWMWLHLTYGVIMDISDPNCALEDSELVCNYTNTEEVVLVTSPLDSSVAKLTIHNAMKLNLSEYLCVDIALHNVSDVAVMQHGNLWSQNSPTLTGKEVRGSEEDVDSTEDEEELDGSSNGIALPNRNNLTLLEDIIIKTDVETILEDEDDFLSCQGGLTLSAQNSVLQAIPKHTTQLDLENCVVASLATGTKLENIVITHSSVGSLEIPSPLTRGGSAMIQNSTIEKIRYIELQEGSKLSLEASHIYELANKSLVISGGSVHIADSIFGSIPKDSFVLKHGGTISLNNNTGVINLIGGLKDAYQYQNLSLGSSDDQHSTFYAEMIAVSVTLALVSSAFVILVCQVWRKSPKSKGSTRELSTLDGNDKRGEREAIPLLEDISPEVKEDLETIVKEVTLGVNEETSSYLTGVNDLTDNYQSALNDTQKEITAKELTLDADMKSELQALESRYNKEFREPTMFNWEKIKELLLKSNEAEVEQVREKYRERKYDIQNHCDVHKLHYNVALLRQNKQHLMKLSEVGRSALIRWSKIRSPSNETRDEASAHGRLFSLLESLLINLKCDLEQSYEREILEEDKKYSEESEALQKKLVRKMEKIESEFNEECKKLEESQREEMEYTSLWNTQYVRGKVEILYKVKTETARILQSLNQKKAQDKYSDVSLKLRHLESLINLQIRHITNMEKLLTMIIDTLTIYGQVTGRMSVKTLEEQLNLENVPMGRKRRSDIFLRLLSATQDVVDSRLSSETEDLTLPMKVNHIYEQLEKELTPRADSQKNKAGDVGDGSENQEMETVPENKCEKCAEKTREEKASLPGSDTEEKQEKEEEEQNKAIDDRGIEEESQRELQDIVCHSITPTEDNKDNKSVELSIVVQK